jgi:hypothetical protein
MTVLFEAGPSGGRLQIRIAALALAAIAVHLLLRYGVTTSYFAGISASNWPFGLRTCCRRRAARH